MEQAHEKVSVGELCRVLDVSESGYCAWRATGTNAHEQRDAEVSGGIQSVFDDNRHTDGSLSDCYSIKLGVESVFAIGS